MDYKTFIDLALSKGITNIQITIDTQISSEVYYINNSLADYSDVNKKLYNIKAEYNGKIEQLQTEYLDKNILDLLIEKINLVDTNYENEFLKPRKSKSSEHEVNTSVTEEINKIKELYKLKDKYPLIKTIELFFSDEYLNTQIINNDGADIYTTSHVYNFYAEAVAEKNKISASFDRSILVTDKTKINFENMVTTVLEKATLLVNKKKLKTKRYNVVIDNSVVSSIILSLKNMMSAQSVHKKISCLTDKLNEKIFSNKLTIIEEPLNKKYPGYTEFDKEGVETFNKTIIENGILKTYLYDNKEAKVDNKESTGNNYGSISTRNMYIKPNENSVSDLLKQMNDGIYITDKMGSVGTAINESTGNISIQVFGFIVKDGKLTEGFTPVVMTTTIYELLSNIEQIGNDLTFSCKEVGCPSLYIKDISITAE